MILRDIPGQIEMSESISIISYCLCFVSVVVCLWACMCVSMPGCYVCMSSSSAVLIEVHSGCQARRYRMARHAVQFRARSAGCFHDKLQSAVDA